MTGPFSFYERGKSPTEENPRIVECNEIFWETPTWSSHKKHDLECYDLTMKKGKSSHTHSNTHSFPSIKTHQHSHIQTTRHTQALAHSSLFCWSEKLALTKRLRNFSLFPPTRRVENGGNVRMKDSRIQKHLLVHHLIQEKKNIENTLHYTNTYSLSKNKHNPHYEVYWIEWFHKTVFLLYFNLSM